MNEAEGPPKPPEGQPPKTERPFQPNWAVQKEDEFSGMAPVLQLHARQLHQAPESVATQHYLEEHYLDIERQVGEGKIPETEAADLLIRISERLEALTSQPKAQPESSTERALGDLNVYLGDLITTLRQTGELRPSAAASAGATVEQSSSQVEELRNIFGRLPTEMEKARWVDVEYSQEFYTRFTPNMEPNFYTRLETAERAEWDARWKLARAAFYKKIYSAFPEKLAENQDLVELTTEQMEILYELPGVKAAMEWYVSAIVKGDKHVPDPQHPGETLKTEDGEKMTILDCRRGEDFERFRETLREDKAIRTGIVKELIKKEKFGKKFGIDGEAYRKMSSDQQEILREEIDKYYDHLDDPEREAWLARISDVDIKGADAVAWNFIWCCNLVESFDSRYVKIADFRGKGRHANLAPAVCSDDLRAVFHPQEKFEDKCSKGQDWGAFGRWGQTQMERIKQETEYDGNTDKIRFTRALSPRDFWRAHKTPGEKGKPNIITVSSPECYPPRTMRSLLEETKLELENTNLVRRLLEGDPIDWKEVGADPWKTSYLTIHMRKAVKLAEYFAGGVPFEPKSERKWVHDVRDFYVRLGLKNLDNEFGKNTFHNLKVWAFFASVGGVTKPHLPELSRPLTTFLSNRELVDTAIRLRNPVYGYLDRGVLGQFSGETFDIRDIIL